MEADKKHSQVPFGLSIVDLIDKQIQKMVKKEFMEDTQSPPEYWVSLNNEDMNNQKLMITINHCGIKFTEVLFPRKDTEYGYESVLNQIINMYNQTM